MQLQDKLSSLESLSSQHQSVLESSAKKHQETVERLQQEKALLEVKLQAREKEVRWVGTNREGEGGDRPTRRASPRCDLTQWQLRFICHMRVQKSAMDARLIPLAVHASLPCTALMHLVGTLCFIGEEHAHPCVQ